MVARTSCESPCFTCDAEAEGSSGHEEQEEVQEDKHGVAGSHHRHAPYPKTHQIVPIEARAESRRENESQDETLMELPGRVYFATG